MLVAWGQISLLESYPTLPNTPVLAGIMVAVLAAVGGALFLKLRKLVLESWRAARVRSGGHGRRRHCGRRVVLGRQHLGTTRGGPEHLSGRRQRSEA